MRGPMNRIFGCSGKLVLALALLCSAPALAKPGAYKDLGGSWDNVRGVAALDGKLYAISGAHLWATEKTGKYKDLGGSWDNVSAVAAVDGKLYVISGAKLWEATKEGQYKNLGGGWDKVGG